MSEGTRSGDVLLALETSGDLCGVALLRAGRLVTEYTFRHEMHLSERLFAHIESVLGGADCTLSDVDRLAVGIGPGSFTGTRIGVMTMKTLAVALGLPIYGVSGLEALAAEFRGLADTAVVSMLPCRSGVVFAAACRVEGDQPEPLFDARALAIPELVDLVARLETQHICFCGAAAAGNRAALNEALSARRTLSFAASEFPRVSAIGDLAWRRWASNDAGDDPLALAPHYISPPPITLPKGGIPGAPGDNGDRPEGSGKGARL